jgi:4-hydroxybenzoate polyprenyltransferase
VKEMNNSSLYQLVKAIRPKQWIKNTVVFAALIFAQELLDPNLALISLAAFFLFCLLSGSVYLINDVMDMKEDQRHPYKKARPIASGKLKRSTAVGAAIGMSIFSVAMSFFLDVTFGIVTSAYFVINMAYSRYLKHVVIIDVMVIAFGFVLRAMGGAVAIKVEISPWLVICTTLLSLFLGFGKRRHELVLMKENAKDQRPILSEYSPYFLDQIIAVLTASIVVTYALYTMSESVQTKLQTTHLTLTIPFVLYGIFRYLYLIHQKNRGGNPTSLFFTDKPLLINVVLWAITACAILYF